MGNESGKECDGVTLLPAKRIRARRKTFNPSGFFEDNCDEGIDPVLTLIMAFAVDGNPRNKTFGNVRLVSTYWNEVLVAKRAEFTVRDVEVINGPSKRRKF